MMVGGELWRVIELYNYCVVCVCVGGGVVSRDVRFFCVVACGVFCVVPCGGHMW